MAGYKPRWFTHPQTVTHPSTNLAWRTVTLHVDQQLVQLLQAFFNAILTSPPIGVRNIGMSVSVCLSVSSHVLQTACPNHEIFCTCNLSPWLNPPVMTVQYVMYFRTRVVPRNRVLHGGYISMGRVNFEEKGGPL